MNVEIIDALADLVGKVDQLLAGPINQAGPFDTDGNGPISQVIGDEYIAALDVLARHDPGRYGPKNRRRSR